MRTESKSDSSEVRKECITCGAISVYSEEDCYYKIGHKFRYPVPHRSGSRNSPIVYRYVDCPECEDILSVRSVGTFFNSDLKEEDLENPEFLDWE